MIFSTSIVTVPERLSIARRLADPLQADLVVDLIKNGSWWGHKKALLNYRKPYHLVLEDDVQLCTDFIEGVEEICGLFPNNPLSLFNMATFTSLNRHAQKLNISFIGTNGATGQAQLWPAEVLKQFILWCDAHIPESIPYEDTRLWLWLKKTNTTLYLTCPNLVEHMLPHASTLGFKGKNRTSADFLGPRSAKMVDWATNLDLAKSTVMNKYDYSTFWKKYRVTT